MLQGCEFGREEIIIFPDNKNKKGGKNDKDNDSEHSEHGDLV